MKQLEDEDPVNELIRQNIRRIRKERNLSSREVALLSGIPEGSYNNLENGFYRISLCNLYKIVNTLGVAIEDLWPLEQVRHPTGSLPLADVNALGGFRFLEICKLTYAEKAALLSKKEKLQVVYSIKLTECEERELQESILVGLPRNWKIYRRTLTGTRLYLCLKGAILEEYLERLISTYLDLWLASVATASPLSVVRLA